jgi:hypothetical protein
MNKWNCNYELGNSLTKEQLEFFEEHGVIIFRNFLTSDKISTYLTELKKLEATWIEEKKEKVNGIPLKYGKDVEGKLTIQRLCFSSLFSQPLHNLLEDERLMALT